jgi:hypothetical protein
MKFHIKGNTSTGTKGKDKAVLLQACSGPEGSRKLKGKAVLLQAWSGPEGSRKLKGKAVPFQEVKVPGFLDNSTGWW